MLEVATGSPGQRAGRAWLPCVLEAAVSFTMASAFVASSLFIRVNPLSRLGQVSGLAALAFRFALVAIGLVIALIIAERRRGGAGFDMTARLVCAAIAGLATGMLAGGIVVALRGTPWGINGRGGDVGYLAAWAMDLHRGDIDLVPQFYPPLPLHILDWYSDLLHVPPYLVMKHLQIAGVATSGPIVYLGWRLLLRPAWALGIGVVASLPLIEPYKPYPTLVLAVFVPLVIHFLQSLRRVGTWPELRIARAGVVYGLVFGFLALMYSGWFQWSVPGLAVATLVVFPWRSRRKGVYLVALTAAVFLLTTRQFVLAVLDYPFPINDKYVYFDVQTEPMYVAMWRNDTPGVVGVWPPIGELGGVGLFTIALAIGTGVAVVIGRRKTLVIGVASMMAGAWLLRLKLARALWATKLVQLYPRTTALILYCLLILAGYAVYLVVQRRRRPVAEAGPAGASGMIGAMCGLLLLLGSVGSALADRYMPNNLKPGEPTSVGYLTFISHATKQWLEPKPTVILRSRPLPWLRPRPPPEPGDADPPGASGR